VQAERVERRQDPRHEPLTNPALIDGVVLTDLTVFADDRGSFSEAFRHAWFPGVPSFVQGNLSRSKAGVVRGMHFHLRQHDLWVPVQGRLQVGLFDMRNGSPTQGVGQAIDLDAGDPRSVLIPPGVAHGFQALSDAVLLYLVTEPYDGTDEHGFRFDDPGLGFTWPLPAAVVSDRDREAPALADVRIEPPPKGDGGAAR